MLCKKSKVFLKIERIRNIDARDFPTKLVCFRAESNGYKFLLIPNGEMKFSKVILKIKSGECDFVRLVLYTQHDKNSTSFTDIADFFLPIKELIDSRIFVLNLPFSRVDGMPSKPEIEVKIQLDIKGKIRTAFTKGKPHDVETGFVRKLFDFDQVTREKLTEIRRKSFDVVNPSVIGPSKNTVGGKNSASAMNDSTDSDDEDNSEKDGTSSHNLYGSAGTGSVASINDVKYRSGSTSGLTSGEDFLGKRQGSSGGRTYGDGSDMGDVNLSQRGAAMLSGSQGIGHQQHGPGLSGQVLPPPLGSVSSGLPPPMSSRGSMLPPPMSSSGRSLPPPLSSSGAMLPPPMSSMGQSLPPPMSSMGQSLPPPMSQSGAMMPPPMGLLGQNPLAPINSSSVMMPPPMSSTAQSLTPPVNQGGAMMPPPMSSTGQSLPPPVNQGGAMMPPPMSSTAQSLPPPVNQGGAMMPPPMSSTAQSLPPPVNQGGAMMPPPMSSAGQTLPVPVSQSGAVMPPPMSSMGQSLPQSANPGGAVMPQQSNLPMRDPSSYSVDYSQTSQGVYKAQQNAYPGAPYQSHYNVSQAQQFSATSPYQQNQPYGSQFPNSPYNPAFSTQYGMQVNQQQRYVSHSGMRNLQLDVPKVGSLNLPTEDSEY